MKIEDHPTARRVLAQKLSSGTHAQQPLEADSLKNLARQFGADDVGLVELSHAALDNQREEIQKYYPWTKSLLSFVVRMTREPIKSSARSVANLEFHRAGDQVNEISARIVRHLEDQGIRAVNPSMGFPMEVSQMPDSATWIVSHKPIAVAAGLGHMGIHRNVIHPKFGNFILLGTVLLEIETSHYDRSIEYNPCLECKLCVAACPVGAISPDGSFNFTACFTHNYREFMGGFTDWVEQIADSRDALDYRRRVSEPESASMWQSLSYGANYKAAYCIAVCPAGEDVIGPYLQDRKAHVREVLKPLQEKEEPVYVIKGSTAERIARKKWPNKTVKPVGNSLRARSIESFLSLLPAVFDPPQARKVNATYHFRFTGEEQKEATVIIRNKTLKVLEGHVGTPNLRITADSTTWLQFLAKEKGLLSSLLRAKIRLRGNPRWLKVFGRCFPSGEIRRAHVEVRPVRSRILPAPAPYFINESKTKKSSS